MDQQTGNMAGQYRDVLKGAERGATVAMAIDWFRQQPEAPRTWDIALRYNIGMTTAAEVAWRAAQAEEEGADASPK